MYGHCAGDITDDTDSTEPEVINHSPGSSAVTIPGAGSSDVTNSTVKKTVLTQVQQQGKMILTVVDVAATVAWSEKTQTAQSW